MGGIIVKDLVVIGGGPGGYAAAIRACQLGMKVALIERDALGGTCLNRGCIPTKAYHYNARILYDLHKAAGLGIEVENARLDMQRAKDRKDSIVRGLVDSIQKLLEQNQAEVIKGTAGIIDPQIVEVEEQRIKTRNILIASGSRPADLSIEGADLPGVMNSDEILELTAVPPRLAIIGGGVIGLEFASIFNQFGSAVTVIEKEARLLNAMDEEISRRMLVYLKKTGISIFTGTQVQQITAVDAGLNLVVRGKKEASVIEADVVLLAAGREPVTDNMKLADIGIELGPGGFIKTDGNFKTNRAGIYAIGDVIGSMMLAHVASEEGIAAVEHMAGKDRTVAYASVPQCIFTLPEAASVGMSEEEARERGLEYKVGKYLMAANSKAMTMGKTDGMVKILADQEERVIGVHIIGPHASDLILEGTIMVKNQMQIKDLLGTIHPHPTLGEALMEALHDIRGEAIHLLPKRGNRIIK